MEGIKVLFTTLVFAALMISMVQAVSISSNVEIKPSGTSTTFKIGQGTTSIINLTVNAHKIGIGSVFWSITNRSGSLIAELLNYTNSTYRRFNLTNTSDDTEVDIDMSGLEAGSPVAIYRNGTLKETDDVNSTGWLNFTYGNFSSEQELEIYFPEILEEIGPPYTTTIRFLNCSDQWEIISEPENQTSTQGIINITNIGIINITEISARYVGIMADNWTLYALGNYSYTNSVELTTNWQAVNTTILLEPTEITMIWMWANCSYITSNPNVSIEFRGS